MDLFDLLAPEERTLAKETFHAPYSLIDLSQATDEELEKYLWFGSMSLLLKHIHDSDILPFFKGFLDLLKEIEKHGESRYIYTVISYIAIAGKVPDKEEFLHVVKNLENIDKEETMQSLAEYLEIEVFKIGFEKGRKEERLQIEQERAEAEQERSKAEQQSRIKIAKSMFANGISLDKIAIITEYSQKELKLILS